VVTKAWQGFEVAWAGGFFEGEGYVSFHREAKRKRRGIVVGVLSTNRESLERFQAAVGVGNITGPRKRRAPTHKLQYVWQTGSISDARSVLDMLWPYLSDQRREKAMRVLAEYG
jgi:hypothetical protein